MIDAMLWNSWWRHRVLRKYRLPDTLWQAVLAELPLLQPLRGGELVRLRELVTLFLHQKSFESAAGLELTPAMSLRIAMQACLPILNLDLDYYRGWFSVIVYPASFVVNQTYADEAGVVHKEYRVRAGEAWERGPLILSWLDVLHSGADGVNVVIHECAHKLDMLNGMANGLPPLHAAMRVTEWSRIFNAAYKDLGWRVDNGLDSLINPYGGESPAEFFAVVSEAFFEIPAVLKAAYPAVYELLCAFYRQDPLARLTTGIPCPLARDG
jgi:Mlc titration factor MtfA (ptsG expression regulator)